MGVWGVVSHQEIKRQDKAVPLPGVLLDLITDREDLYPPPPPPFLLTTDGLINTGVHILHQHWLFHTDCERVLTWQRTTKKKNVPDCFTE